MNDLVSALDRARVFAIFEEGYDERLYQAERWATGDIQALDRNDDVEVSLPETWGMWMDHYKGTWNGALFPGKYTTDTLNDFRRAMLKVMMLAVAAILWVDRRLEKKVKVS